MGNIAVASSDAFNRAAERDPDDPCTPIRRRNRKGTSMLKAIRIATGAVLPLALAAPAQAALVVSKAATANVGCDAGMCSATAADAVLNVKELKKLLRKSDAVLISGAAAQDIVFAAELSWPSAKRLTVDAWRGIAVDKPMTV